MRLQKETIGNDAVPLAASPEHRTDLLAGDRLCGAGGGDLSPTGHQIRARLRGSAPPPVPGERRASRAGIPRGPDFLRRDTDGRRYHGFQRGPGLFQGFPCGCGVVAMGDGKTRQGLAPLLQGSQHISGMPVFGDGRSSGSHGSEKFLFQNMRKVCSTGFLATAAVHGQTKKCGNMMGVYFGASASAY